MLTPRKPNDVVYGQKIRRIIHLPDEVEFMVDIGHGLFRQRFPKGLAGAFPGQHRKFFLRRPAFGCQFFGINILQRIQREPAGFRNFLGSLDRIGVLPEQTSHLPRRFQPSFGILVQPITSVMDRAFFPDTSENILQFPPHRIMIMDIIGGHHRHPELSCQLRQTMN